MNKEVKEILELLNFTNDNIMWCDAAKLNVKQSHLLYDYIINLEEKIDRLNNMILKIEQHLIDCGVDDEILKLCGIYDVNGVELRKYIIELKEGIK